jgi:alkanesulfonate monooxygenase SsuD/methylene tetrahydromethanopterin reductase-like flavin-dependent oxidoreductase (luciferase family)
MSWRTSRRTGCCVCSSASVAIRSATSRATSGLSISPAACNHIRRGWHRASGTAGACRSAIWAGHQGINYLTSSVVSIEGTESRDFATIQAEQIDAFRAHHPHPDTARVCHGLVVIPTDSASAAQIEKYREYAADRFERTKTPQGPRGMLFSPDFVGTSDELADALHAHAGFQRADEVAFALPFTFGEDDYIQIVTDMAEKLGPKLGWTPNVGGGR